MSPSSPSFPPVFAKTAASTTKNLHTPASSSPITKELKIDQTKTAATTAATTAAAPAAPSASTSPRPILPAPSHTSATPTSRQRLGELKTVSALRDVGRQPSSATSNLYISELKTDGFAILVSDCHHVLEWPTALLPSTAKKGDLLQFNLTKTPEALQQVNEKMSTIQQVLRETAVPRSAEQ
jgi:hypothetical protein